MFFWPSAGRSHGRPCQRSVDRAVDRHAQTCTACLTGGPIDRPGRPPESSALWKWPRLTERSTGRELLLSVSRPRSTAGTTVRNLTVGRSTGRSTASSPDSELASNGHIFEAYKRGFSWTVLYKNLSEFSS